MGTKSISGTLTVNTVEDGVSQPSYIQTQEAWSNQTTSASSSTMPSDLSESSWKDYTPTKDKTYLWRRSRTMTLNSSNQYVAGSWTYQRLSGDNGTSINPKGSIDYAYSSKSGFPPASSSLAGKTAVAKGSNKIYRCDVPQPGYYDWLETGSTASVGDSYTVDAGNLNGSYQSTDNMHGHLIMWSSEASQWIDLGVFQGESGVTYYTHIAWATGTTDPTQEHPAPSPASGQTSIPNKYAVTGFSVAPFDGAKWMGVLVNQTVADSTRADIYTWDYVKGDDAVNYKISLAGSQFAIDPNEDELHVNIKGKVYKIVGGNTSAYTDLVDSQLSLYFEDSHGNKDYLTTFDFSVSGATFSTTYYDGTGWSDEQVFVAVLTIGGVEVARESIQIEKYGQNGQNGQRGKMSRNIYCAGKWNELTGNVQFEVTDYSAPYVDISESGTGQICKVYVGSNGTKTFPTTRQGYLNSSDWADMATDFKYIITQAIFSSFAKLGSFIISGDYFISQYGTLLYNNSGNIQKTTIDSTNVSALFDGRVAYAWFDDSDPMAETNPSLGSYKFRPTKCMDALSGEEWMAGGSVHVSNNGDVTMNNAIIEGSLMYHKVLAALSENSAQLFSLYDADGNVIGIDSATRPAYARITNDTVLVSGLKRANGFTVFLPPASLVKGAKIKIVNSTYSKDAQYQVSPDLSKINIAVVYRDDFVSYGDDAQGYAKNLVTGGVPYRYSHLNNAMQLVGAVSSTNITEFSAGSIYYSYGVAGDPTTFYSTIELISALNPFGAAGTQSTDYAWMIIEAK